MRKSGIVIILSFIYIILFSVSVGASYLKFGQDIFLEGEFIDIGDVNRDDEITIRDALMILKRVALIETYEENFDKLADVNDDKSVNAEDALNVLKYVAKAFPVETVVYDSAETYTVKLGNSADYEQTAKIIRTYDKFVEYIDSYVAKDPNAFEGKVDEIKANYKESFFNDYYLMAVCVNNEFSNTAKPTFEGIYRDNGTYEVKLGCFTADEEQEGASGWCMFIKFHKSSIVRDDNCRINVVRENEIPISEQTIGPMKAEANVTVTENSPVKVISTYEEYLNYINRFEEASEIRKSADSIYNEEFFAGNDLLAVRNSASEQIYDVLLHRVTVYENLCNIYIMGFEPVSASEEKSDWYTFIPVTGKHWGDIKYSVDYKKYTVDGYADDAATAASVSKRIRSRYFSEDFAVISTYEDYISYIRNSSEAYGKDLFTGCTEEFFENNSLIFVYHWTTSGSHSLGYNSMEEVDGGYKIILDYFETTFGTDDIGSYCITIPVEGKGWEDKKFELGLEYDWKDGTVFSTHYWDVKLNKIGEAGNVSEGVTELKSYEEFVAYVKDILAVNPDAFEGKGEEVLAYYNEATFEEKNIAAIKLVETKSDDYIFDFLAFEYSGGKYNYVFKAYLDKDYTEGSASWCAFAPVPKGTVRDGYQLGLIKEYEEVLETNKSEVLKVEVKNDLNQWYESVQLIDTYAEYEMYMSTLKDKAIGNYESLNKYDEEYFANNVLVVAEYVDASYSIESSYVEATQYRDEFVINVERYYPNVQHEGMRQWNMIVPLEGRQWLQKDLSLNITKVEEDGEDSKARTMWVSTASDIEQSPQYIIINSYEDYNKYMDYVKQWEEYTLRSYITYDRYKEEYFEENALLMVKIDGRENPYDADVVSKVTDDGQIVLDIDRYHNTISDNNGSIWNIFVPLPGKDWSDSNVTINYTDSYPSTN